MCFSEGDGWVGGGGWVVVGGGGGGGVGWGGGSFCMVSANEGRCYFVKSSLIG